MADGWEIVRRSPGYPPGLLDLDHGSAEAPATRRSGAPPALRGCGSRELVEGLATGDAVTIVGARRSSGYGRAIAFELAGSVAAAGLVVVSGMAFGIDTAAHHGALEAAGPTVAVLAGGADMAYPPSARSLHARILREGGAAISEAAFGARPARWHFPARNRIMAAISAMTIVVEATERSGSRITADRALELGRIVGAVPGPVHSRLSAGPHALLGDGAHVVTGAQDVLDLVLGVGAVTVRRQGPKLDSESAALLSAVGPEGSSGEALAASTALPPADVAVALARLELQGYVRAEAGRYTRTGLEAP